MNNETDDTEDNLDDEVTRVYQPHEVTHRLAELVRQAESAPVASVLPSTVAQATSELPVQTPSATAVNTASNLLRASAELATGAPSFLPARAPVVIPLPSQTPIVAAVPVARLVADPAPSSAPVVAPMRSFADPLSSLDIPVALPAAPLGDRSTRSSNIRRTLLIAAGVVAFGLLVTELAFLRRDLNHALQASAEQLAAVKAVIVANAKRALEVATPAKPAEERIAVAVAPDEKRSETSPKRAAPRGDVRAKRVQEDGRVGRNRPISSTTAALLPQQRPAPAAEPLREDLPEPEANELVETAATEAVPAPEPTPLPALAPTEDVAQREEPLPSRADTPFNANVARVALDTAASSAAICGKSGLVDEARVQVLFTNSGAVRHVKLLSGDLNQSVASCVVARFQNVRVPPYAGDPRAVQQRVALR